MINGLRNIITESSHEDDTGYPTFRYGEICKSFQGLNSKKAKAIGVILEDRWKDSFERLMEKPGKVGFVKLTYSEGAEFFEQMAEGPIYIFPELDAIITDGIRNFYSKVRSSITVCLNPNHSKIWLRFSYFDPNNSFESDQGALVSFFSVAEEVCKNLAVILKNDIYKISLEFLAINANLETIHKISIYVISRDRISNMSIPIPDNAKKFDANRINGSIEGFCLKFGGKESTEIICLIEEKLKKGSRSFACTKDFSKTLVELLALRL